MDAALRGYVAATVLCPTVPSYPMMYLEMNDFEWSIEMYQRALDIQDKWDSHTELQMFDIGIQETIKTEMDLAYGPWARVLKS